MECVLAERFGLSGDWRSKATAIWLLLTVYDLFARNTHGLCNQHLVQWYENFSSWNLGIILFIWFGPFRTMILSSFVSFKISLGIFVNLIYFCSSSVGIYYYLFSSQAQNHYRKKYYRAGLEFERPD